MFFNEIHVLYSIQAGPLRRHCASKGHTPVSLVDPDFKRPQPPAAHILHILYVLFSIQAGPLRRHCASKGHTPVSLVDPDFRRPHSPTAHILHLLYVLFSIQAGPLRRHCASKGHTPVSLVDPDFKRPQPPAAHIFPGLHQADTQATDPPVPRDVTGTSAIQAKHGEKQSQPLPQPVTKSERLSTSEEISHALSQTVGVETASVSAHIVSASNVSADNISTSSIPSSSVSASGSQAINLSSTSMAFPLLHHIAGNLLPTGGLSGGLTGSLAPHMLHPSMVLAQQVHGQVSPAGDGGQQSSSTTRGPPVAAGDSQNPEYFMRPSQMPPSSQSDFMTL